MLKQKKYSRAIIESMKKKTFMEKKNQVLPRLELGSLDSKSKVLTITPQDQHT